MIKVREIKLIDCYDLDALVIETYGKPYCFQQQEGYRPKGLFYIEVPSNENCEDEMYESIPETLFTDKMGVKFDEWLKRDASLNCADYDSLLDVKLWWERHFYPSIYTLVNDLYNKGLILAGEYYIEIN